MLPVAFQVAWQHLDVAVRYFEEILLDLEKKKVERVDEA